MRGKSIRAPHSLRWRQGILAAAIVLTHGVVIQLAVTARLAPPPSTSESLAWIPTAKLAKPLAPTPRDSLAPVAPRMDSAISLPSLDSLPSIAITPHDEPKAALRDLVSCALPENGKLWIEERKRCEDLTREVRNIAVPRLLPTENEIKLARQFARAKAVQDAPILLPCFGAGISVVCLLSGAVNGFNYEMGSYAGSPQE